MTKITDDSLFIAMPLSKVIPDDVLVADIYLKIDGKYLKYKEKGDELPSEKHDLFLARNVKSLFVKKENAEEFIEWMSRRQIERIEELTEKVGEDYRDLVEKREQIREILFETFADEELDSDNVAQLKDQAKDFIAMLSKDNVPQAIIAKLTSHNPSLADHSVNVANIAVFLAMVLGHGDAFTLELVYLGGIFHDYGKCKIPANILENPDTVAYTQSIKDHPVNGYKLIKKIKEVPEQVSMIVLQHHEQYNGQGYPKGLQGDEIYELARIVSIANHFDNAVLTNMKKPKEMYKLAAKTIEYDRGKNFDPKLLDRVVDGLKLAYAGYKK